MAPSRAAVVPRAFRDVLVTKEAVRPPLARLRCRYMSSSSSRPLHPLSTRAPLSPPPVYSQSKSPYSSVTSVDASNFRYGQPVHETHPHILGPGQLTVGISAQEYADRRARLAQRLPVGGVAILQGAELKYRSGAVFHPFRQESNFFYLTGFMEEDALAVIQNTGNDIEDYHFALYVRPKDPDAEQWSGPRTGIQAAKDVFNADSAGDIARAPALLASMLRTANSIFAEIEPPKPGRPESLLRRLVYGSDSAVPRGTSVQPLRHHVHALRSIKSVAEIALMRAAGKYSGRAITETMRHRFTKERDLEAFLEYEFKKNGCDGSAYVPVIAGSTNALCIHYVHNNDVLHDGDMVLVDAGGELGTYITDITRTWPINGKFTAAQKDLYNAVLQIQRQLVSRCHVSANNTLDGLHAAASSGLRKNLEAIGFDMRGNAIEVLFPHHVGHYVGLDVHDTPGLPRSLPLRKGMCITIEPGIYVPDDDRWPAAFRGMGIRIEDSICVDDNAPLTLTTEAVKEIDDIEALSS